MARRKLRIGIVGCGGIARAHRGAIERLGGAEIASVYDIVASAAESFAAGGARVAASPQEMAERDGLDAVSVCSPPAAHLENCRPFLKAGIPILCEKPLAAEPRFAAKLAALVKQSGSPFMMAFCHRFHPPIIKLKQLIDRGALGRPLLMRNIFGGFLPLAGNHRADPALSGGGCLIDHCCHSIDLYRFLVGEPAAAQAVAANVVQDVPVEDVGMIHLLGPGAAHGEITASYSLRGCRNRLEWYGTEGAAYINYWVAGEPELTYIAGGARKARTVDCSKLPDRFTAEMKHFLQCVRGGRAPAVTVDDGLRASRIVAAVYAAAGSGRRVAVKD